jgi:hypothetical protein
VLANKIKYNNKDIAQLVKDAISEI